VTELLRAWRDEFDFGAAVDRINAFPNFLAVIDGLQLHFIHQRNADPAAVPLLLLHGWPGSFVEMLGLIPRLSASCHVVVPSLPGFGFSESPRVEGISTQRMARMFADLMRDLGYDRFVVHGGDFGAGIATWMARNHPERVAGMHLNYIPGSYDPFAGDDITDEERSFLRNRDRWLDEAGAYGHVQRTRPLTLGYALSDSPAGLAAWIAEKFREWADPSSAITIDDLLTNITVYWATNTIASSMRLYLESARTPLTFRRGEHLNVPCAIARFPLEEPFPPRSWIERVYDVRRWTDMPRGGHFAALEAADLLAADIVAFLAAP